MLDRDLAVLLVALLHRIEFCHSFLIQKHAAATYRYDVADVIRLPVNEPEVLSHKNLKIGGVWKFGKTMPHTGEIC